MKTIKTIKWVHLIGFLIVFSIMDYTKNFDVWCPVGILWCLICSNYMLWIHKRTNKVEDWSI